MIYELKDPSKAAPVFDGWEDLDAGVVSCLENIMGKIYADDPKHPASAMAVIGDFVFCAGKPNLELLQAKPDRWMLVVPMDEDWAALIESNFPADKRIRYAMKRKRDFDREKLEAMADSLPEGYEFRRIDSELYDACLNDSEFKCAVSVFESKERFLELGRGIAVMKDGKIVSAASTYSRQREGIDIEIDTAKAERHRGLASAAAAKLILECLDEGLYPTWDAANKMSVRLAKKLGYEFSREYVCYGVE